MNQVRAFVDIDEIHVTIHHIIQESYRFVKEEFGQFAVGLLATAGTYHSNVYKTIFEREGLFQILEPQDEDKIKVWDAIYSREFGIKDWSKPVSQRAVDNPREVAERRAPEE